MRRAGRSRRWIAVSERGYGKRTGPGVGVRRATDDDDIVLVTDGGRVIRTPVKGISVIGRNTQEVRLIDVAEGEKVVSIARLAEKEEDEESAPPTEPSETPEAR